MFGIHNYTGFVAAIIAFQIIPGPGTLSILNATARDGVRSGMGAVFGLAAVLAARPAVLSSLQWLGIAYLCWFGLKLLRKPVAEDASEVARAQKDWRYFRQAFAVCLTNPKAIMFFMAFFPLFLTPDSRPQTLGVMMAHVSLISLVYQVSLVFIGNAVALRFARFQQARFGQTPGWTGTDWVWNQTGGEQTLNPNLRLCG